MSRATSQARKTIAIIVLIGAVFLGSGALLTWNSSPSLLLTCRAKRIFDFPYRYAQYQWRTDQKFLLYYPTPSEPITEIDTRTGASKVLGGLRRRTLGMGWPYRLTVSPDGARALWLGLDGNDPVTVVAALDGSSLMRRVRKRGEFWADASVNAVWLPDSRRWVQLLAGKGGDYAIVSSLDAPRDLFRIPIGVPRGMQSGFDLMQARLLGYTNTGRVLATPDGFDYCPSRKPERKICFFDFDARGGPANVHQVTIDVPKAQGYADGIIALGRGEDVVLSPQGDGLAWWICVMEAQPALQQSLSRWIPSLRRAPHSHQELWTSRLDGSDMKLIGFLEDDHQPVAERHDLSQLHWLPSGRAVSFLYENALWTVPVQ